MAFMTHPVPHGHTASSEIHGRLPKYMLKTVDWLFPSTFGATLACTFLLALLARGVPVAAEMTIEEIPNRFVRTLMPDRPAREKTDPTEKTPPTLQPIEHKPTPKPVARDKASPAETAGTRLAMNLEPGAPIDLEKRVTSRGLLVALGVKGKPTGMAGDAVADVLSKGLLENIREGVFDRIGGVELAITATAPRRRAADQLVKSVTIAELSTTGVTGVSGFPGRKGREAQVAARVTAAEVIEIDSPSRSPAEIRKVMSRRMNAIQHCFEKRLKLMPELRGKVTIRFVIHQGGAVIASDALEDTTGDQALVKCIAGVVKNIRFPNTTEGETVVTYPFLLAPGG